MKPHIKNLGYFSQLMEPLDIIMYPIMCVIIAFFFTHRFNFWFAFLILFCTLICGGVIILLIIPPQKRRSWWICGHCERWDYSDDTRCPNCNTPNLRKELQAKQHALR